MDFSREFRFPVLQGFTRVMVQIPGMTRFYRPFTRNSLSFSENLTRVRHEGVAHRWIRVYR